MERCSQRRLVGASVVTVAACSLLAAGCGGGGSSPGVANVATSTTTATTTQTGLVAFAACMRSHGVAHFPGPESSGIPKLQVVTARQSNPGKFDAAQAACSHLLPNGSFQAPETAQQRRTQLADELSFARCMRSHGVAGFPDPNGQGQLTVDMVEAAGIDVHSAAVLRVVQTCLPASHGGLTAAKVKEAIDNAGGG